ncbi:MAG: hypothetical protein ACK5LP_09550 [Campylobacteraceae bacterium]
MSDKVIKRLHELKAEGNDFLQYIKIASKEWSNSGEESFWFETQYTYKISEWMCSVIIVANEIKTIFPYFYKTINELCNYKMNEKGDDCIACHIVKKILGTISSFLKEYNNKIVNLENEIIAISYDNFLDNAQEFLKNNKKIESSILASIVFEDTLNKIIKVNNLNTEETKDKNISELVKLCIFSQLKAKHYRASSNVRNNALHAKFDEIDKKDIQILIDNTRELISKHLSQN